MLQLKRRSSLHAPNVSTPSMFSTFLKSLLSPKGFLGCSFNAHHCIVFLDEYKARHDWPFLWRNIQKFSGFEYKQRENHPVKMLGPGEPCAKKPKYHLQQKYNERRKEKPRKPQFSLSFQFNFGEEGEMRLTNQRFVRLRNMANLRAGRSNADFLQALLDRYEGKYQVVTPPVMHLVEIQSNSTESVFELHSHKEKKIDFTCQWPGGEAATLYTGSLALSN